MGSDGLRDFEYAWRQNIEVTGASGLTYRVRDRVVDLMKDSVSIYATNDKLGLPGNSFIAGLVAAEAAHYEGMRNVLSKKSFITLLCASQLFMGCEGGGSVEAGRYGRRAFRRDCYEKWI